MTSTTDQPRVIAPAARETPAALAASAPLATPTGQATSTAPAVPAGLKGVVVAQTQLSDVLGDEGYFHYRGVSAPVLARTHSLESVWSWLWDGVDSGPLADELADSVRQRRHLRGVEKLVTSLASVGSATEALRTALSALASLRGARPLIDLEPSERRAEALALCACTPVAVAAISRARNGHSDAAIITPDPDLGHAGSFLHALTGRRPDPSLARALERYLILTIDHGFNASTFTARVIASTGADMGSAIVGAFGALSGPLHGGAPSRCLEAIDAVGSPSKAGDWVSSEIAAGRRLMGFGHAVYRTDDPRSTLLREVAVELGGSRIEIAQALEVAALEQLSDRYPSRPLRTNVEFWASVVLERCGIPPEAFTSTFAVSRVIGWSAHIMEQANNGVMFRPSAEYIGEAQYGGAVARPISPS